jgi:hypothetical protein
MVVVSWVMRCFAFRLAVDSDIVISSLRVLITAFAVTLSTASLIAVVCEKRRVLFANLRIESETLTISAV